MRAMRMLLAAFLLCAGTAASAQGLPTGGSSWKYSWRDQQYSSAVRTFTVEVLDVQGTVVRELLSVEGGEISQTMIEAEQARFLARPLGNSVMLVELAPYANLQAGGARVLPGYPPAAGVSWEVGPPSFHYDTAVVPAGSFAATRVEVRGTTPSYGQGSYALASVPGRFIFTVWYSPELKRYVKIRHQTWNRFGQPIGDELVQLIEYRPGK